MRAALLLLLVVAGCARPQVPQGGPVPEVALQVLETTPVNLSVVEPFDGPIQFRFPRTLSEQTVGAPLQEAVLVSPASGEVDVSLSGETLEVSMEGGFLAGELYRVTVFPRLQDRFQNVMVLPYELFFSTGPDLVPSLLAGLVTDRLTLDLAEDVRVDAVEPDGRVLHATLSDSTGFFSFPFLPAGDYTLVAYEDGNRDGEPGFLEVQDSLSYAFPGDTAIVTDLALLAPDSTAAVLTELAPYDSVALRATFDDYLDPDVPLAGVQATVTSEDADDIAVAEYLHLFEWEERQAAAAPPADGAAAPGGDPAVPGADPAAQPPPDPPDPAPPPQPDVPAQDPAPTAQLLPEIPLPVRDLVVVLSAPLQPGVTYQVELSGVTNINGIPDGGGSEEITSAALPPGQP